MGNFIASCHQQHTPGNTITSDEVDATNSRRRSEHFVFLQRGEQAGRRGRGAGRDVGRGRTHAAVGDEGAIYSRENSFLVGGRTLPRSRFVMPSNANWWRGIFLGGDSFVAPLLLRSSQTWQEVQGAFPDQTGPNPDAQRSPAPPHDAFWAAFT